MRRQPLQFLLCSVLLLRLSVCRYMTHAETKGHSRGVWLLTHRPRLHPPFYSHLLLLLGRAALSLAMPQPQAPLGARASHATALSHYTTGTGAPVAPVAVRLDSELVRISLRGWQTARGYTQLQEPARASLEFTPALSRCVHALQQQSGAARRCLERWAGVGRVLCMLNARPQDGSMHGCAPLQACTQAHGL